MVRCISMSCCLLLALDITAAQINCHTSFSAYPGSSNLGQITVVGAYESTVRAGVPYNPSVIDSCTDSLATGSGTATIRAYLIPLGSTVCPPSDGSIIQSVFDGNTNPNVITSLSVMWSSQNTVSFPNGGQFTICYYSSYTPDPLQPPGYRILPLIINVQGINRTPYKIFCLSSDLLPCSAYLAGYGLPGDGTWKLAPTLYSASACGASVLLKPFSSASVSASVTTSTSSYEIHNFGLRDPTQLPASYKACYCAGYQFIRRQDEAYCTSDSTGYSNYLQYVGNIIMVSLIIKDSRTGNSVSVYPRMRVDIQVLCGSGGCSSSSSPRIKLIESNLVANLKPYYDETAGCRFAVQSKRYMSPTNCDPSTFACNLVRSDMLTAPDLSLSPTWNDIKIDSELSNFVRVNRVFDLCYCDADCAQSSNWFFVSTITALALQIRFWNPNSLSLASHLIPNQPTTLEIFAVSSGPFAATGSQTREMKLVADNTQSLSSSSCLSSSQSSYVSGHYCYTNTDCENPTFTSSSSLQYGPVSVSQAGWYGVCYCNEKCTVDQTNWLFVAWILVPGPSGTDVWYVTQSQSFIIQVNGWGLDALNTVVLIPASNTCTDLGEGVTSQPVSVVGPTVASATVGGGPLILSISDPISAGLPYSSVSVVKFASSHFLSPNDWIRIQGVSTGDSQVDSMFNNYQKVSSVVDANTITIPIGFLSGKFPTSVDVESVTWSQTNKQIFSNFLSSSVGEYSVCWYPFLGATSAPVFAGTVHVEPAPEFSSGSIDLVANIPAVASPAVIRFTTGSQPNYINIISNPIVRLIFTDLSLVYPINAIDDSLINPLSLPSTLESARLDVCSLFVSEASFQLPMGCFLVVDNTAITRWELNIVFEKSNGLSANSDYTIVMNMVTSVGFGVSGFSGIEVWAMDDLVQISPYSVIERFPLIASSTVSSVAGTTIIPSLSNIVSLHSAKNFPGYCANICIDVICVTESDCEGVAGSTNYCSQSNQCTDDRLLPQFSFSLSNTGSDPLQGRSSISLFFWPFLDWDIGSHGVVTCTTATVGKSCASESITVEHVSPFMLRITLPNSMDPITSGDIYTYAVGGIRIPKNGVQSGALFFHISSPDKNSLGFFSSKNWVVQPKLASASLLTRDGNEKPFVNTKANVVYMKLVPGFNTRPGTTLIITMPPGYVCRQYSVVGCGAGDVYCNFSGLVPDTLTDFGSSNPSGRSQLGLRSIAAETNIASWSGAGTSSCRLLLKSSTTVFSSASSIYMALMIDNPLTSLLQSDENNQWTLSAEWTDNGMARTTSLLSFSSNLPVIGKLTNQLIVPSKFALGNPTNNLYVFFRTSTTCVESSTLSSQIWVDAPQGFNFHQACTVTQLEPIYNVLEGDADQSVTLPLPTPQDSSFLDSVSCSGIATSDSPTYNRAIINMAGGGGLIGGATYGFRIVVSNPLSNPINNVWNISTFENLTRQCEGSATTVPMISQTTGSWQLYSADMGPASMKVGLASMQPFAGSPTLVSVGPFYVSHKSLSDFRVTAPPGYIWSFDPANFQYKTAVDGGAPTPNQIIQSFSPTLSLPLSILPVPAVSPSPQNVLEFQFLSHPLRVGDTYGFSAGIKVPRRTPTSGPNVFIFEFGYNAGRTEALVVPAPHVQSVINGEYDDSSLLISSTNSVCLGFQIISSIPRGGAIRVTPPGTGFTFPGAPICVPRPWNNLFANLPPVDSVCTVTLGNVIKIVAGPSGIVPAQYQFCFQVINPSVSSNGVKGIWTVDTLSVAAVDTSVLDFSTSISGSIVAVPWTASRVVQQVKPQCKTGVTITCTPFDVSYWSTGRNDRPNELNSLVFELTSPTSPTAVSGPPILFVRAPAGFVFDPACLFTVVDVLGFGIAYPQGYTTTPVPVKSCSGQGRFATLTLSSTLAPGLRYLIGLKVTNPSSTPASNFWTLTYNEFGSEPSIGFNVWALEDTNTVPTNFAVNEPNIVEFSLTPLNGVPVGGFLAVSGPEGFTISTACTAVITVGGTTEVIPSICAGTGTPSNEATITLTTTALQGGGVPYTVALTVNNPSSVVASSSAGSWTMTSYSKDENSGILDSTSIPGFQVTSRIDLFAIVSATSQSGTESVTYTMRFALPITAEPGDQLQVRFPTGFVLNGYGKRSCQGFTLLTYNGAAPPPTLSGISPVCGGNSLMLTLASQSTITRDSVVVFIVNSINPPTQPDPNVFLLTQYSTRTGSVVASRLITGLSIYPKLIDPKIVFGTAPAVAGADSLTTLNISFIPMSNANLVSIQGVNSIFSSLYAKFTNPNLAPYQVSPTGATTPLIIQAVSPAQRITLAGVSLVSGTVASITIRNVGNPSGAGKTKWSLVTFSSTEKRDEIWNVNGPTILGKITVLSSLCSITPNLYKSTNSRAIFAFTTSIDLDAGSVILLTPPPGFTLIPDSFIEITGVYSDVGKAINWIEINTLIRANSHNSFAVSTTTPNEIQNETNWYMDVYSNLTAGTRIATNDKLFEGFKLIGVMPFVLSPENYAPSSFISLRIDYRLPNSVIGINSVTVSVMAPIGFEFASSCLVTIGSSLSILPIFSDCVGTGNVANLTSSSNVLQAGSGTLTVSMFNPESVPEDNTWTVGVVADAIPNVFANMDTLPGYTIKSLVTDFVGGNRLAAQTLGFFTFALSRTIPVTTWYFKAVITPHIGSGYALLCTSVFDSECEGTGSLESPITIKIPVSSGLSVIEAGTEFCVGIAINNPSLPVLSSSNYFSLVVIDPVSGTTIDANMNVKGTSLKATQMSGAKMRYQTSTPNSLSLVEIEFRVDQPLMSSSITDMYAIRITAPTSFIISGASTVKTTTNLGLAKALPITVSENVLTIFLDPSIATPPGTYVIQFPVMNPGSDPVKNLWLLQLYLDLDLMYNSPIAGYKIGAVV